MTHVAFNNTRLFAISSVQPHAVPYGNRSFGIRRLCGIDNTLRLVGVTEGKELLANVDTRVELDVRRRTLTVILRHSNLSGPSSGL